MPNASIKCERVYRALRRKGMSKQTAARISNAMWRKGRCGGAKRGRKRR